MDQNENEDGWEWPFWKRYETWWTKMKNLIFKGIKMKTISNFKYQKRNFVFW